MVYPLTFMVLASADILSLLLIFVFKDILHSVLALSVSFFVNSLIFLLLSQPLLALIQLFIMVGGISTYLFVGVASAPLSHFKHTSHAVLAIVSVVFFAACFYNAAGMQLPAPQNNALSGEAIATYLASSMGQLYMVALVLFGAALGSIALLKKGNKIK